jgi:hypothetical protein
MCIFPFFTYVIQADHHFGLSFSQDVRFPPLNVPELTITIALSPSKEVRLPNSWCAQLKLSIPFAPLQKCVFSTLDVFDLS